MTTKKTQKVKVAVSNTKKVEEKQELHQEEELTDKEKKALDAFFEKLKESVTKTAKELNLALPEPHNYYVSYAYRKGDDRGFGSACFTTNVNVWEKHGYGMDMLAKKFEQEHNYDSVIIINVMKMQED